MDWFLLVSLGLVIFFIVLIIFLTFQLRRVEKVSKIRIQIIDNIYLDQMKRIHELPNKNLSWEVYESITFNTMVNKFWRELDSFYPPEYYEITND